MEYSAATKQAVYKGIESFFARPGTSASDISQLLRFLKASPATAPVSKALPADELEERLQYAQRVIDKLRVGEDHWQTTAFVTSVFFSLPYDKLIQMEEDVSSLSFLWQVEDLLRAFLQLSGPANPRNTAGSAQVARNRSEAEKCLMRDNSQCILTHTLNPEVCHIVPFAFNSNLRNNARVSATLPVLKSIIGDDYKLLTSHIGCSDRQWNMLSLNSQVHTWWARGMFAFKCLGVTPTLDHSHGATVTLQFYWMTVQKEKAQRATTTQSRSAAWEKPVNDGDRRAFVEAWETTWQHSSYGSVAGSETVAGDPPPPSLLPGVVAAPVATTSRLVQTGHVVEIPMSTMQDGLKMKAMIDVQWACIRLASMSGAAGDPDFLRDPYDDYDDYDGMDVAASAGEDFVKSLSQTGGASSNDNNSSSSSSNGRPAALPKTLKKMPEAPEAPETPAQPHNSLAEVTTQLTRLLQPTQDSLLPEGLLSAETEGGTGKKDAKNTTGQPSKLRTISRKMGKNLRDTFKSMVSAS